MEDLRQMWQQYDEKLQRTQTLNEQLLRKLNSRYSADRFESMRNLEYFGLFFIGILAFLAIMRINTLNSRWEIALSYVLVVVQLIGWLAWSIRKLAFLNRLNMDERSVTDVLGRISRFRLMLIRERLWGGLSMMVFFIVPCIIVLEYWLTGKAGILIHWQSYVVRIIPALAIGTAVGLWIYRAYYLQPIDEITRNLRELEEFSQA